MYSRRLPRRHTVLYLTDPKRSDVGVRLRLISVYSANQISSFILMRELVERTWFGMSSSDSGEGARLLAFQMPKELRVAPFVVVFMMKQSFSLDGGHPMRRSCALSTITDFLSDCYRCPRPSSYFRRYRWGGIGCDPGARCNVAREGDRRANRCAKPTLHALKLPRSLEVPAFAGMSFGPGLGCQV